uniref:Uncharacterized protein n=1 Tax=Strigamia maritima TaxID=126957 RepID=T1IHD2_STRMM
MPSTSCRPFLCLSEWDMKTYKDSSSHLRRYPDTSNYHRKWVRGINNNIWRSWLYQREIGCPPPLGLRDRQSKDIYSAVQPTASWNTTEHGFNHGAIFNLEFSPDGKILVAACESKSFLIFDPLNGRLINDVTLAHSSSVNCVRFLDSRVFATCSDDTTVALWDIRFPKHRIRSLRGHSNWVKNIDYADNSRLLVTSGFDGSVFVWDINRFTEDIQFKQVCHINGLMRTKLTPDESKLVMCTTAGYMMIIHDLDLSTLARDINTFNPNAYRLMQLTGKANRRECSYNYLFESDRKKIDDFPEENQAEIISSLQIHPQGWCVLSRNTSSDKQSEVSFTTCLQSLETDSITTQTIKV